MKIYSNHSTNLVTIWEFLNLFKSTFPFTFYNPYNLSSLFSTPKTLFNPNHISFTFPSRSIIAIKLLRHHILENCSHCMSYQATPHPNITHYDFVEWNERAIKEYFRSKQKVSRGSFFWEPLLDVSVFTEFWGAMVVNKRRSWWGLSVECLT